MIRDIRRKYFEVWGDEEAQNSILKGLLIGVGALLVVQSIAVVILALKRPVLIAMNSEQTRVFSIQPPGDELLSQELKRTVRGYVETHYTWDSSTVEKAHSEAARYVAQDFIKAFVTANAEQVRLAREKKLAQKVYVTEIAVDAKALTARVTMDRILSVEGLRAASSLALDITFSYGPRNPTNPTGIYITGEKIVSSQM